MTSEDARSHLTTTNPKTTAKTSTIPSRPGSTSTGRYAESTQPPNGVASQQSASSASSSVRAVVGTSRSSSASSSLPRAKKNSTKNSKLPSHLNLGSNSDQCDFVIPASDGEAEEEEDVVPASPPPIKRARILFQRCYDPTLNSEDLDSEEVYVPDSDDDV